MKPLPFRLKIALRPGGIVRVAWPATAIGYNLEGTPPLPGAWTLVTEQPVVEGNPWVVQLPLDTAPRFFRVKKEPFGTDARKVHGKAPVARRPACL